MTNEETLKPEDSFALIQGMINTAKNKLADDGFFFIFWGWLVLGAALIHYVTFMLGIPYGEWVWPILMPLGGLISAIVGYRKGKKEVVRTHLDVYLGYVWGGFGLALVLTLVFMPAHGIKMTYFFLMLLYGLATFVSGGLLKFKPLIFGSLFSFAFAALSVFLGKPEQLLCISGALLFSYIIPGHLLRVKYKSQENV
jgi:hypothetical protein